MSAQREDRPVDATATAPLRIAVIGAECTGKTTLCRELALAFAGDWVAEALREFVDRHRRAPTADEQAPLLAEQLLRERQAHAAAAQSARRLVAFDSAPLVTALYSRMYFADDALLPAATEHQRRYDLTLVADIDLPWVAEGAQRDSPQARARFHALMLDWLDLQCVAFAWVRGDGPARRAGALAAISAKLAQR